MIKKIAFRENHHGPEWYWSPEKQDMVCRCACGGPLDCDRNVTINAWNDHVEAISEFISSGEAEDLKGLSIEEIKDILFSLIEFYYPGEE